MFSTDKNKLDTCQRQYTCSPAMCTYIYIYINILEELDTSEDQGGNTVRLAGVLSPPKIPMARWPPNSKCTEYQGKTGKYIPAASQGRPKLQNVSRANTGWVSRFTTHIKLLFEG